MSVSSGTMGSWDGTYLKVNCRCRQSSGVQISKSQGNPNKLYYYCRDNKCGTFIRWGILKSSNSGTFVGQRQSNDRWKICIARVFNETKDEIIKLKEDSKMLHAKLEKIEVLLGNLKTTVKLLIVVLVLVSIKWE
ncbi:hypothetical protein GH714_022538 [Hevea brasiliensis]|uniref:Zinc finger GRF-type domain-containing protein n=1 Tax=Hevea brasiliensis TaxID=3981 RepID=A0A6A6LFC5_HEVBR|nr:hypothetical protein GH714_022538 [Hevea brasiliensis]